MLALRKFPFSKQDDSIWGSFNFLYQTWNKYIPKVVKQRLIQGKLTRLVTHKQSKRGPTSRFQLACSTKIIISVTFSFFVVKNLSDWWKLAPDINLLYIWPPCSHQRQTSSPGVSSNNERRLGAITIITNQEYFPIRFRFSFVFFLFFLGLIMKTASSF